MLWFGHMLKLKSVESGPFKKQTNKKHVLFTSTRSFLSLKFRIHYFPKDILIVLHPVLYFYPGLQNIFDYLTSNFLNC